MAMHRGSDRLTEPAPMARWRYSEGTDQLCLEVGYEYTPEYRAVRIGVHQVADPGSVRRMITWMVEQCLWDESEVDRLLTDFYRRQEAIVEGTGPYAEAYNVKAGGE